MRRTDIVPPIPQRERVTYLSHLQARLGRDSGVTTGFAMIEQALVLHVIPLHRPGDRHPPGRAVTVGCCYHRATGAWWFYWPATGHPLTQANELEEAAHTIRTETSAPRPQ